MKSQATVRRLVALTALGLLGLVGVGAYWAVTSAAAASQAYHHQRQLLDADLRAASGQGYTAQDLAPITTRARAMDAAAAPVWMLSQTAFFDENTNQVKRLRSDLKQREQQLLTAAQTDASKQVDDARAGIAHDKQVGADDPDVAALQKRLDDAAKLQGAAHTVTDFRAVAEQALGLVKDTAALAAQVQAENAEIDKAAQALLSSSGGNLEAIRKLGQDAAVRGRNDASVAFYMNKPGPFKGFDTVQRAYSRLERFVGEVGSGDVNVAAHGAAAVGRYADAVHYGLMGGFPHQAVVISFQDQHLWAYQDGKLVLENAVTTGIRGVTDFGTDFGPMKVLYKEHPHTMKSPWPKNSPYWYPDTVVQWAVFFTWTGESIHDSYWEPDSLLGPGSQYDPSTRSHGCVHLPLAKAQWMFDWAPVNMPVVVYPGDGSPVANQLSLMTTNDQGVPRSGGG
jgi:L,D-transpeptidase catalytic domain